MKNGKEVEYEEEIIVDEGGIIKVMVEENKVGGNDYPNFVLTRYTEKCIHRPWRRGVIVKLLERRIDYKSLETKLNQMSHKWFSSVFLT